MLKTIRKYNKIILAVGGTLLLVSFLIPQAIQQWGQAGLQRKIGTMDGRAVSVADFDLATREFRAIEAFFRQATGNSPLPGLDPDHDAAHWMLLTSEADQAGMVGGPDEGARLLPIFARDLNISQLRQQLGSSFDMIAGQNPDLVRQREQDLFEGLARIKLNIAAQARLQERQFDLALAKLQGVFRLVNQYRYAERLAEPQAVTVARDYVDSIVVDAAFLSGRRLADQELQPDPESMLAHFERFRELSPGEGEFGIGYKLPERVKLEWIALSPGPMREAISISVLDSTKFYRENQDRFEGEFDEHKDEIETELTDAKLQRVFGTAESVVRTAILNAVRLLEEEGDYLVVPDQWAEKPDFLKIAEDVVAAVRDAHGVEIPPPAVYIRDNAWLDQLGLSKLPGLGGSQVRFGRSAGRFEAIAMQVRELTGDSPLALQVGIPSTDVVAQSFDGTRFYFNILDAAPTEAPTSPEQLLDPDQLRSNYLSLERYEELVASTDEFLARVEADGLEAFAESFGEYVPQSTVEGIDLPSEPRVAVREAAAVRKERTVGLGNGVDNNEAVINAVLARGQAIDPTSPIEDTPLAERIVLVPTPDRLGVVVARIESVDPLTREMLPAYASAAVVAHKQSAMATGLPEPFRFETLKERHGFEIARQDGEAPLPEDTEDQDAADTDQEEQASDENAPTENDA